MRERSTSVGRLEPIVSATSNATPASCNARVTWLRARRPPPLAVVLSLAVEERDDVAEIDYGKWDGLSADVVAERWHDEHERWSADPAWKPPTAGETAIALARRMARVVEEITLRHRDGNVLLVSHKASIRVLLCELLGVDVGRFRYRFGCPVGSVSIVAFGAHGPLAEPVADRAHLSADLRGLQGT